MAIVSSAIFTGYSAQRATTPPIDRPTTESSLHPQYMPNGHGSILTLYNVPHLSQV